MRQKRTPGAPLPPLRNFLRGIIFVGALILLMLLWRGIEMITDWFWFQEVGFEKLSGVLSDPPEAG
ncbi:MAG: hypothetical protein QME78_16820 [Thermodesulfobacteriota bacterium]|nr:hypothetical protein [Thermodesulfobacteriota bacterium]